jgi:hypothetical protein
MQDAEQKDEIAHRDDKVEEVWATTTHVCGPVTELAFLLRRVIIGARERGGTRDRI